MRVYKIVSLTVAILLITVLFACAVTVPAAAQYDTMQYRYDATHSGDYSEVAGPVPSNGQLKWNYTTGGAVESSPAVANGVVYVGSDDNNVYAINATTGANFWNYAAGGYQGVYSSPAVANGVVYVGSSDKNLYALYANNGTKLWNYTTGGWVYSSPAVANGVVYVGSWDGNLYAINATTGAKVWNYTTGGWVLSSPAVANGVVYVGSWDGNLYAINAANGTKLWNYPITNYFYSSPAVANGVVYVGGYNDFYAINATTGVKLWDYTTGSSGSSVLAPPAVANGVVYVGSLNGNVYAINATTGVPLWNLTTAAGVTSSPTVANGVVYVGSEDSNLYALYAGNGAVIWNYTTGNAIDSSPAIVNGVVYVGSYDGNLYAIGTIPTTLTATVSTTTAYVNQNFTINGTLSAGTTGIDSQTITLQNSTDNATWNNVTTNVTDATGTYQFSNNESAAGTYYYRTAYDGNDTYANATSNSVTVHVNILTQLSAATNLTSVAVNEPFTINGTLNATDGTPIAGATITLQNSTDNATWNNVTTNVTDATGTYQFSNNESAAGTYYYRTAYDGNATYVNATSAALTVYVDIPTQLSAATNLTSVAVNTPFTINGTLTDANGTPIAGAIIQLQKNVSGAWTDVAGKTNTTQSDGFYAISTSEGSVGAFDYRAAYDGNATYVNATSNVVNVTVTAAPIPLAVTAVDPANNTANVPITKAVNVTFNQTIQAGANYSNITLKEGTLRINATTTIAGTTLTVTPNATLAYSTAYTLTIPRDAVKNGTQMMTSDFTSTFTTVAAPKATTTINAIAPATATVTRNFTTTGRLTANGTGIAAQNITLQRSTDNTTWSNATSPSANTTGSTGWYSLSRNETSAGTYYYRTTYPGNATSTNATSNIVKVTIVPGTQSTQLSLSTVQIHVTHSSPPAKVAITYAFSGTLAATQPKPVDIANAKIYLQWSKDNKTWSPVSPTPAVTNANGAYAFKGSLAPGTYYFRTAYNGASPYTAALSRVAKVSVSSTGSSVVSYL